MLSRREIVLIIILLVVIAGTAYFLLFLQPTLADIQTAQASITSKEDELVELKILEAQYAQIVESRSAIQPQWEAFEQGVPQSFDDTEVLRIIQKVIYPYTENIDVEFPEQGEDAVDAASDESAPTLMYRVALDFTVPYEDIEPILEGFKEERLVSRVVEYDISRIEIAELGIEEYSVSLGLDFLTQNR